MKSRSPLVMIISLILALLLSVSVYVYLNALENKTTQVTEYALVVASIEIPQYTKITENMIIESKVKQLPVDKTAYYGKASELIGKYTGEKILKGEPFFKSRILDTTDNNLTLTLTEGNRAVSVMANFESGVTKMVKTGDYIDLLVTLPELKDEEVVVRPDISKLFLQKILILAVDQKTSTSADSTLAADAKSNADSGTAENIFYLTLSIPAKDIEKVALAENIGRLKFALRAKGDETLTPTDGTVWEELIKATVPATPTPNQKPATPSKVTPTPSKVTPTPSKINPTPSQSTPTTKTPSKPVQKYKYYVVKPGDTLMNIARTQLNDASKYKLLQEINHIADPSLISPGTRIKIPVIK